MIILVILLFVAFLFSLATYSINKAQQEESYDE